jgi:predicted enzyme related to lactoylglutathione lyase
MSQTIHHAINWFEIPVSDMARSVAFYEQVLGVKLAMMNFGGGDAAVFPADVEQGIKGCLMLAKHSPIQPEGVLIYLNAGRALQPALDRLAAAGGKLLTPRVQLPGGLGCFAHIADPDGQRIGLHALD